MKVFELIAILQQYDQDVEVLMDYGGDEMDIDGVSEEDGYLVIR